MLWSCTQSSASEAQTSKLSKAPVGLTYKRLPANHSDNFVVLILAHGTYPFKNYYYYFQILFYFWFLHYGTYPFYYYYYIFFQFTKLDSKSTTSSISSEERGGASLFVLIFRGISLHLTMQDGLLRMFILF